MDQLDHQPFIDVLTRYAWGVDRRDWAVLDEVFVEGVTARYRAVDLTSRQEVVDFVASRLATCGATQHLLGLPAVHRRAEGTAVVSTVTSRCMFRAWHQAPAPDLDTTFEVFGYYVDDWRRTDAGWRISRRDVEIVGQVGDPAVLAPLPVG